MAADTNQLDPNTVVFDITYEMSGTETVAFNADMKREVRYWLERKHGAEFTSRDLINELNEWAESHVDLPYGDHDFWDFDWSVRNCKQNDQEAWLFELIKGIPFIPPEIQGQSQFFEHSPDSE